MGLARHLGTAAMQTAEVLFPPACPICREETGIAEMLCPDCWTDVAFLGPSGCETCNRPVPGAQPGDSVRCDDCTRHPPGWRRGAAAFQYADVGRRLVLALKHGDRLDLAPMLGGWLLRAGRALVLEADLVAPVPLHWSRRLKRRTNQAAVLAHAVCRKAERRDAFAPRLLLRTTRTQSQDGKNRAARTANIAGAFTPGPDARQIEGKRILLIDDVLTTGATLSEAARVCMAQGAASIDILVLALVVSEEYPYILAAPDDEEYDEDC